MIARTTSEIAQAPALADRQIDKRERKRERKSRRKSTLMKPEEISDSLPWIFWRRRAAPFIYPAHDEKINSNTSFVCKCLDKTSAKRV